MVDFYNEITISRLAKIMLINTRQLRGYINTIRNYYKDFGILKKTLTKYQVYCIDDFFDIDLLKMCKLQKTNYSPVYTWRVYQKKELAKRLCISTKTLQRTIKELKYYYPGLFMNYKPQQKILSALEISIICDCWLNGGLFPWNFTKPLLRKPGTEKAVLKSSMLEI